MMKMLLCVSLFSLFCSVYTLQCYQNTCTTGPCPGTSSVTCTTGQTCISKRTDNGASTTITRACSDPGVCTSLNAVGSSITLAADLITSSVFAYLSCCSNADNCNSDIIPDPNNTANGLKCFACNSDKDTVCNTTVSCVGSENRCSNGTFYNVPANVPLSNNVNVKGCVSKSVCDLGSKYGNVTCCIGNLCNGSEAWHRLDLSILLVILTATILLQ